MKKFLFLFIALVSGVSLASTTDGVGNLYWIGDVDANYATPGNWRFSSASGAVMQVAPIKNDYQAKVRWSSVVQVLLSCSGDDHD